MPCEVYSVQCSRCHVKSKVCRVNFAVCCLLCAVCTVQCNVQCFHQVREAPISGNIDNPEGGFDALMQVRIFFVGGGGGPYLIGNRCYGRQMGGVSVGRLCYDGYILYTA